MHCSACGKELSAAFPGATVECACGTRVTLDTAPPKEAPIHGGPYRASGALPTDDMELRCPYCGNTCSASLRVCPRCDVRFDRIRCVRCYTLQPPGSFSCARCGTALELEPLLDPTAAPCPHCRLPLEAAGGHAGWADGRVHECPRCGGLFVPRDALAELLHRAEVTGPFPDPIRAPVPTLEQVRYVPCPQCHTQMNRVNFGKVSGVIVDVCRAHGTWFDTGELTRVISFAASGGLMKTRQREDQEKRDAAAAKRENAAFQAAAQPHASFLHHEQNERLEEWVTFLKDVLFW